LGPRKSGRRPISIPQGHDVQLEKSMEAKLDQVAKELAALLSASVSHQTIDCVILQSEGFVSLLVINGPTSDTLSLVWVVR
jgi:hypothetical protein